MAPQRILFGTTIVPLPQPKPATLSASEMLTPSEFEQLVAG